MTQSNSEPRPDDEGGANGQPSRRSILALIFGTAAVILAMATVLWMTGDDAARGAAVTLVGAAVAHLLKETQETLKLWQVSERGKRVR